MRDPGHTIVKVESTNSSVKVTLANGVDVYLSSNDGSLHLHFSGVQLPMKATPFAHNDNIPGLEIANYVDVKYKSARDV